MVPIGVGGGADTGSDVPGEGLIGHFLPVGELHQTLGVADPGGDPVQDGDVPLFGDFKGGLHVVQALLGVGGLHHGQTGGPGVVPVVLLVLGGVHGGVVGGDDDEALVHAVVGGGENGVSRHVDANVLHGGQAADAAQGSADGNLGGHLFIGGPLAVQAVLVLGEVFKDFRAGCAGISGAHLDARFVGASCRGFVAGEQVFHRESHLSEI